MIIAIFFSFTLSINITFDVIYRASTYNGAIYNFYLLFLLYFGRVSLLIGD